METDTRMAMQDQLVDVIMRVLVANEELHYYQVGGIYSLLVVRSRDQWRYDPKSFAVVRGQKCVNWYRLVSAEAQSIFAGKKDIPSLSPFLPSYTQ